MINIWAWKDPTNQNLFFFQFQIHLENFQDAFITNNYIPIEKFLDDQEKTQLRSPFQPFKIHETFGQIPLWILNLLKMFWPKVVKKTTKCFDWKESDKIFIRISWRAGSFI